jgi:glycosyltransferase involved in cell wall biosynthesis
MLCILSATERNARGAVSVVILTRNSARTLRQCLEGLEASRVKPAEVIVVDGGSTDETLNIVGEHSSSLNTKVLYDEGRGLGYARDIGWREAGASSRYIAMIDSDVVIDPEFFSTAVKIMDLDEGLGALMGKLKSECNEKGLKAKFQVRNLSMALHIKDRPYPAASLSVSTPCTLYRKEALKEAGGFSDRYVLAKEDSYIAFKLRAMGYRLSVLNIYARHLESGKRFWRVNFRYGRSYPVIAKDFPKEAPLWSIRNRVFVMAIALPFIQTFIVAWYFRRYLREVSLGPAEALEMSMMETIRQLLRYSGMLYQYLKGGVD